MTAIAVMPTARALAPVRGQRTIWGLDLRQLHDRFWASRGVQVIRAGEAPIRLEEPELFMLTDPRALGIFRIDPIVRRMQWLDPALLMVRLRNTRKGRTCAGHAGTEAERLSCEKANTGAREMRSVWVAFTTDRFLADRWQSISDTGRSWRMLRRYVRPDARPRMILPGRIYCLHIEDEFAAFAGDLVRFWPDPGSVVNGIRKFAPRTWAPASTVVGAAKGTIRGRWVGVGRAAAEDLDSGEFGDGGMKEIKGTVLWDDPAACPKIEDLELRTVESVESLARTAAQRRRSGQPIQRACDVVFSAIVLTFTLPLFLLVMLAIYLESGRPIFCRRRSQTKGGREFSCLRFRTMRSGAIAYSAVVVEGWSRGDRGRTASKSVTRVGAILRRYHVDELPMLINVLRGDMSVVGPSPRHPAASHHGSMAYETGVRPGITGPWRIQRLRGFEVDPAQGVRLDLEYQIHAGRRLDLKILIQTLLLFLSGADR
jgi:lipopolysaccharide/colanic/teichoic acid biosynthesis glycosyltransferase